MIDKEWLDKVHLAAKAYNMIHSSDSEIKQINDFVKWLYFSYGIVLPEKRLDKPEFPKFPEFPEFPKFPTDISPDQPWWSPGYIFKD